MNKKTFLQISFGWLFRVASRKEKKGFLQISFGWLFALIVGAFILFLAGFIAVKFIGIGNSASGAETTKSLETLFNPLETSFESSKVTNLEMPTESRIYADCNLGGEFGEEKLRTSQKSFGDWTEQSTEISTNNNYIFLENPAQGKDFVVFSKPVEMPFKVADVIYLVSKEKDYCFIRAPESVLTEVSNLKIENILNSSSLNGCVEDSVKVCFGFDNSVCDVYVNINQNSIEKGGKIFYYSGDALLYAGIFSDKDNYECQIARLMKRLGNLASLYKEKELFVRSRNCINNANLDSLISVANNFGGSSDIREIDLISDELKNQNEFSECKLW